MFKNIVQLTLIFLVLIFLLYPLFDPSPKTLKSTKEPSFTSVSDDPFWAGSKSMKGDVKENLTNDKEISYIELKLKLLNQFPKMTEAQMDEYRKTFYGMKVNWPGRVLEVDKNFFDKYYTADIDIDEDGRRDFSFEKLTKAHALQLGLNKTYKFSGEIIYLLVSKGWIVVDISYSK